MGAAVGCLPGGIRALARILDDEDLREALQSDLLERGMSLDQLGETLSWWDLKCVLKWLPHDSAVSRHRDPHWWRTIEVELQAAQLDTLRGANWQRAGGGDATRPTPVLPPLDAAPAEPAKPQAPKMTPTAIRDELARRRALRAQRAG